MLGGNPARRIFFNSRRAMDGKACEMPGLAVSGRRYDGAAQERNFRFAALISGSG
jgi:hypothetical protein